MQGITNVTINKEKFQRNRMTNYRETFSKEFVMNNSSVTKNSQVNGSVISPKQPYLNTKDVFSLSPSSSLLYSKKSKKSKEIKIPNGSFFKTRKFIRNIKNSNVLTKEEKMMLKYMTDNPSALDSSKDDTIMNFLHQVYQNEKYKFENRKRDLLQMANDRMINSNPNFEPQNMIPDFESGILKGNAQNKIQFKDVNLNDKEEIENKFFKNLLITKALNDNNALSSEL